MPQKIATVFNSLTDLLGVNYTFISYLGYQEANGINHAVLAEQTVLTGKDFKNIVLLIFNEKPEGIVLVNVERVVEGGRLLGGAMVHVQKEIPKDAIKAFETAREGYVGIKITPRILLATKIDKGLTYFFLAEGEGMSPNAEIEAALVTANCFTRDFRYVNILNPDW
jgi:hypothetical protein